MMKYFIFTLSLLIGLSSLAKDGIGGIIGGTGRTWKEEMSSRRNYIGWPEIHHATNPRSYKVHELCIKDNETLASIKTRKEYEWKVSNWRLKRELVREYRMEVERVFNSNKNCEASSYYNCQIQGQYVENVVQVPIYRGFNERQDGDNRIQFLHTNDPQRVEEFRIPKCKKIQ